MTIGRWIVIAVGIVTVACAPVVGKGAAVQDPVGRLDGPRDWLAKRINALHQIPPDAWVELTTPEQIRQARELYLSNDFLAPAASPFQDARPVRLWAHIGPIDVLRVRYEALSLRIELIETAAATLVWLDSAPLDGPDQPARISALISKVLASNRPWFFFARRRGEAIRFSTDSTGYAHAPDDAMDEYDGGVIGGRVYLVRYSWLQRSASADLEPFAHPWLMGPIRDAWYAQRPNPPSP